MKNTFIAKMNKDSVRVVDTKDDDYSIYMKFPTESINCDLTIVLGSSCICENKHHHVKLPRLVGKTVKVTVEVEDFGEVKTLSGTVHEAPYCDEHFIKMKYGYNFSNGSATYEVYECPECDRTETLLDSLNEV